MNNLLTFLNGFSSGTHVVYYALFECIHHKDFN